MTDDPEPELQAAIVALLKADSGVGDLVGDRIFDNPSPTAQKPYISIGETQILPRKAEGYSGSSIDQVLHGWSAKKTKEEAKRIGAAMRGAIDDQEGDLVIAGHRVVSADFVREDVITEPDGATQHVASRFHFLTEPT